MSLLVTKDEARSEWWITLNKELEGSGSVAELLVDSLASIDKAKLAQQIEWARREVSRTVEEFLEQARQRRDAGEGADIPASRILLKAPPSIGKTKAFVKLAQQYCAEHGLRILYLAPTHKLLKEVADKVPGAVVLAGREREGQCRRPEVVKKVIELHQSVERTICRHCPFRDECLYQESQRSVGIQSEGIVVLATHEQLIYMREEFEFDAIVIDESFIEVVQDVIEFHPDRLEAAKAREPRLQPDLDRVLAALKADPTNILDGLRQRGFTTSNDFAGLVAGLEVLAESDTLTIDARQPDGALLGVLSKAVANETWKVLALVNQLQREIGIARASANGVEYRSAARLTVDGKVETQERIGVFRLQPLAACEGTPILVLDGTADAALLTPILGTRLESRILSAERNAVVVQATSAQFDRRSMMRWESKGEPGYRRNLASFIKGLGMRKPLLITHKDVEKEMQREGLTGEGWEVAHFGAIRGVDTLKHCDTIIVAGRQQPGPRAVLNVARCLFSDDPEALPADANPVPGTVPLAGCGAPVKTLLYADWRLQAVLAQFREQEIVQAVDRLRLINDGKTRLVVILASIATDIPVNLALSWKHLHRRLLPIAEAARKSDVIRLNPKSVKQDIAQPGNWTSGRQFLEHLSDLVEVFDDAAKDAYRAIFPFHRAVSYRLVINGKRRSGKAMTALVRSDAGKPYEAIAARYANDNDSIDAEAAEQSPEIGLAS